MKTTPKEYYENKELSDKSTNLARKLVSDADTNNLLKFSYNYIKVVKSEGTVHDFQLVLNTTQEVIPRVALISFIVPEYLCFGGDEVEIYELLVSNPGFKYRTTCRIDSNFMEVVYHHKGNFTQLLGRPESIKQFKEATWPDANKYTASLLKSVFTIALPVPTVEDPVHNTALYRSVLRFAVAGLNKYSNCFRRHVAIAWASFPHYSFFSFPYGFIREFDLEGNLVSSDKYMMNPATGVLPERPYCIDPQGTVLEGFKESLISLIGDDAALNMLKKGEAYGGHGHDLIAIRLCVSATETILRSWAKHTNITFNNSTVDKARIKDLLGRFEEVVKRKRLLKNADEFMNQVKEAIRLRHKVEHENYYSLDSTLVFPAIEILKTFFSLVQSELNITRSIHEQA